MSRVKSIHFNALPESVRTRFIASATGRQAPEPIYADVMSVTGAATGWVVTALIALVGLRFLYVHQFGSLYKGQQAWFSLALYALGLFLVVYGILDAVRRFQLKAALPFPPGRYLFATDLVDARSSTLRLIPLASLTNFQGTHHYNNGIYSATSLVFSFEGGVSETISVRGQDRAQGIIDSLRAARVEIADAVDARDAQVLALHDVFFSARVSDEWESMGEHPAVAAVATVAASGPKARDLPLPLAWAGTIAAGLAIAGAYPLMSYRNGKSDDAMFARAGASSIGLRGYLREGKRHKTEAQELLYRVALDEALAENTVTSLRNYLREFPGSPHHDEARTAIHAAFAKVLVDFRRQAPSDDPRLVPFMEKLLAYLEAKDSPPVEVRFRQPTAELAEVDKAVAEISGTDKVEGRTLSPISPFFDDAHMQPRESYIVGGLQAGFRGVFSEDILAITQGARLIDETEPTTPTIEVTYDVSASGSVYYLENTNRAFVGIVVTFMVKMRIPGEKDEWLFALDVQPPETFSVPRDGHDAIIYETMAQEAFEELGTKLGGAFFHTAPLPESLADEGGE